MAAKTRRCLEKCHVSKDETKVEGSMAKNLSGGDEDGEEEFFGMTFTRSGFMK